VRRLTAAAVGLTVAAGLALAGPAQATRPLPDNRVGTVVKAVSPPPTNPDGSRSKPRPGNALPDKRIDGGLHARKDRPASTSGVRTMSCCTRSYAGAYQSFTSGTKPEGVYATALVSNPYINTAAGQDYHSLGEIAVEGGTGNTDDNQIVEVGYRKDHTGLKLFVYHWVNDTGTCYNGCGWVDYGPTTTNAGDDITAHAGSNKKMGIQYFGGNWWINYGNEWIGYYPGTIWSGASPASTFTRANYTQLFGEIAHDTTSAKCTDMGNGNQAGVGAAYFAGTGFIAGPAVALVANTTTDSSAWSLNMLSGTAFYYGGPGRNSVGGTPGTTGSC
jgi:hypothetical protein